MTTNGVQRIVAAIEKAASEKTTAIIGEARTKAGALVKEAEKKAQEEKRTILSRGQQEARRQSQRILADARIRARRVKAKAQEEMIQEAFSQARERLEQIAAKRKINGINYLDILQRLLKESVLSTGKETLEVLLNPRDRDLLGHQALDGISRVIGEALGHEIQVTLAGDSLASAGGVIIRSVDGMVRVDNTFEARVSRFREVIRTEVSKELFGLEP